MGKEEKTVQSARGLDGPDIRWVIDECDSFLYAKAKEPNPQKLFLGLGVHFSGRGHDCWRDPGSSLSIKQTEAPKNRTNKEKPPPQKQKQTRKCRVRCNWVFTWLRKQRTFHESVTFPLWRWDWTERQEKWRVRGRERNPIFLESGGETELWTLIKPRVVRHTGFPKRS